MNTWAAGEGFRQARPVLRRRAQIAGTAARRQDSQRILRGKTLLNPPSTILLSSINSCRCAAV